MTTQPVIAVLCGGVSSEREVSVGSGAAAAQGLAESYPVELFDVKVEAVPPGIDPERHVVFSTLHGTFGEDGGMQRLLDEARVHYAGCDAASSALCFNKAQTKAAVAARGVAAAPGRVFDADKPPAVEELLGLLGEQIVLKPNCQGSSVGLHMIAGEGELRKALAALAPGEWLAEKRIAGREVTVGILQGGALGVVEIVPRSGRFDYASKYTKGMTEYHAPARIPDEIAHRIQAAAEAAFNACGCRDYARIDFMVSGDGEIYFLEINTLPGMKETSLLPMSAGCKGLNFVALTRELVRPALERFQAGGSASPS